jgi:hypothetical protein
VKKGRGHLLYVAIFAIVVPFLIVVVKYAEYAESRFADKYGFSHTFEYGDSQYSQLLEVLYFPAKQLVQPLVDRLPVGGLVIDVAADLISLGLQNLVLLLAFFAWRSRHSISRNPQ